MLDKMNNEVLENRLFKLGMWWRIFYGMMRLVVGFAFLKLVDVPFLDLLHKVTSTKIGEDSTDLIINFLDSLLSLHPLTITYFLAAYLIFWGVVDIFLSACLLKHKLWAFPATLWLIAMFVAYMTYRLTITHSPILLVTILFDVFLIWLINREYKKLKGMR